MKNLTNKTMKTNEEKLKKLLEVAVENGWNSKRFEYFIQTVIDCDFYSFTLNEEEFNVVWSRFSKDFITNLDALIIHFEKDEVSFIEALCNYSNKHFKGVLEKTEDLVWFEGMEMWEQIVTSWTTKKEYYGYRNVDYRYSIRPTSQCLDWLFQTFNHLLV